MACRQDDCRQNYNGKMILYKITIDKNDYTQMFTDKKSTNKITIDKMTIDK